MTASQQETDIKTDINARFVGTIEKSIKEIQKLLKRIVRASLYKSNFTITTPININRQLPSTNRLCVTSEFVDASVVATRPTLR